MMDRIITDPKTRQYIYGILCAAVPVLVATGVIACLLYTSPSPRDRG